MLTHIGAITVGISASMGWGTSEGGLPSVPLKLLDYQVWSYSLGLMGCQAQDHCSWHTPVSLGQGRANKCGGLWLGPCHLQDA